MRKAAFLILAMLCATPAFGQAQWNGLVVQQTASNPLQVRVADGDNSSLLGTWRFGAENILLTPSATNYIYMNLASSPPVLTVNTTGFPTASYYPLATVVTSASQITAMTDSRPGFNTALSSGVGSGTAMGPVINVTASPYNASPSLADNNTAFTAAAAAANASNLTAGNPAVEQTAQSVCATTCTVVSPTISILPGDSVIVFVNGAAAGRTFTVSDGTATGYSQVIPQFGVGLFGTQVYASEPGGAVAAASFMTVTDSGAAEQFGVIVVTAKNVGSYRFSQTIASSSAGLTTLTITTSSTQDTNNIVLTGFSWAKAATTITVSASSGSILQSYQSTSAITGGAVVQTTSATVAAVTNAVTLSTSATSGSMMSIELRSRTNAKPTLYIPAGLYRYSGGLVLSYPGTLRCDPGAVLDYTGSAHAVDLGPIGGLASNTFFTNMFAVDGCTFTGGANMTEGIFVASWVNWSNISNSLFKNFGNSTAYMIWENGPNWDSEIGPRNRFMLSDSIPRNIFRSNGSTFDDTSFIRVHDNVAFCIEGDNANNGTTGCLAAHTGVGFWLSGDDAIVELNNIAFMNPNVKMSCTSQANDCWGFRISDNIFESPSDGLGGPQIQFIKGVNGVVVDRNAFFANGGGGSGGTLVGPVSGTDIITGLRMNYNTIAAYVDANPLVTLNNLVGQTANQSSNNMCSVNAISASHPCVTPHTTGSNIVPFGFNVDDSITATGTAPTITGTGTCATVSTGSGSWGGQITCTTAGTAASTIVITPGGTATHNFVCGGSDATQGTALAQSGVSSTSCTLKSAAVTASDVLTFWYISQ